MSLNFSAIYFPIQEKEVNKAAPRYLFLLKWECSEIRSNTERYHLPALSTCQIISASLHVLFSQPQNGGRGSPFTVTNKPEQTEVQRSQVRQDPGRHLWLPNWCPNRSICPIAFPWTQKWGGFARLSHQAQIQEIIIISCKHYCSVLVPEDS